MQETRILKMEYGVMFEHDDITQDSDNFLDEDPMMVSRSKMVVGLSDISPRRKSGGPFQPNRALFLKKSRKIHHWHANSTEN